jgi:hypothetical protein
MTTHQPGDIAITTVGVASVGLAVLALCLCTTAHAQTALDITLKHGSPREAQTKEQLQRLLRSYELSRWLFTKSVVVDEQAIPHSHPTLTLSARHLHDDELLLSTFVHEELHWFVADSRQSIDAIKELRRLFPSVPTHGPEGANGEDSTYLHLIVCFLEYEVDKELLGELKARQVMDFWATDHYTWVYKTILERPQDIGNIVSKYKLNPATMSG